MEIMNVQPQTQTQVNVTITLTIVPFGDLKTQASWNLVEKPPEPAPEQGVPSDEFSFPEGTPFTEIITLPEPLVIIMH